MTLNVPASLTQPVEDLAALDPIADWTQGVAGAIYPVGSRQRDLASGRLLGHPLHPLLTDVVIGSWVSAGFLDLFGDRYGSAARRLVGLGVLAAVPTALAGLHDWMDLEGDDRRIGIAHALGNVAGVTLFATSWLARAAGLRKGGVMLSTLGMGVASASAWFGGHLAYRRGIGVNRTAFEVAPARWKDAIDESALRDGKLVGAKVGTLDILLVRNGDTVYAMHDRCAHLGCALHTGTLEGDTVVCPCHGSAFALDGTVVRGPATADQPALAVRVQDGKVQVKRRGARR
jgi:nitrite reductase/ring-hydroxylating ferredoxin subunit